MHKKKNLISAISITTMLMASVCPSAVFADSEQVGTAGIRLYGTASCKESGHTVCVDVYAHGKTPADLRSAGSRDEYPDIIVYRNELKTTAGGAYEITFGLGDRPSGMYDAYISCECENSVNTEQILYSNPEESKAAIALLNSAVNAEDPIAEIQKICKKEAFALGFDCEYAFDTYAAQLMLQAITTAPLDPEDKTAAIALYEKAAAIAAVKSGTLTNLFTAADYLDLDKGDIKDFYTKSYVTAEFGTYTTGILKSQTFDKISDFDDALTEQFVLSTVKMPDGYANIQAVVSEFMNRTITDNQALSVSGNVYASYSELENALGGSSGTGSSPSNTKPSNKGGNSSYSGSFVAGNEAEKINKNIFDDIDGVSWAVESIVELAQKGIISGKGDRLFYPNDNITREEFVKIIMLTFFKNAEPAAVDFADVDNSAWYAPYVKAACGSGIINGIGDNRFGTGMNITREDMAVIAYRTAVSAGKLAEEETESSFKFDDDYSISDYAKKAVYALYEAEVISGMTASEFAPKQSLTRAQAAKIIYYIYNLK